MTENQNETRYQKLLRIIEEKKQEYREQHGHDMSPKEEQELLQNERLFGEAAEFGH
jgi:hypothetical protein